ncbi:MAG: hypothetical protein KC420_07870, partial [Myxococcales bacterium]|nr:hypothetical protein [Myxococcales bacterium]
MSQAPQVTPPLVEPEPPEELSPWVTPTLAPPLLLLSAPPDDALADPDDPEDPEDPDDPDPSPREVAEELAALDDDAPPLSISTSLKQPPIPTAMIAPSTLPRTPESVPQAGRAGRRRIEGAGSGEARSRPGRGLVGLGDRLP